MFPQIATLISGPDDELPPGIVEAAKEALFHLGADIGQVEWLKPGFACDLPFADLNTDQAEAAIRTVLGGQKIDVVAQAAAGRRKQILVADMESTLIRNEMLDELAELAGRGAEIAEVTARAMNGEIAFEQALESRVGLLAGLSKEILEAAAARIDVMPGAATLIQTMRASGALTIMVSGGFHYFADRVGRRLCLDKVHANDLHLANGCIAGTVGHPILGRNAKYDLLVGCATERNLPLSATLAVGDGANDLQMIQAAGLGIAYRAKAYVKQRARWRLDHADLTGLLFAQGYSAASFIDPD